MRKSVLLLLLSVVSLVNCSEEPKNEKIIWEKKFINTKAAVLSTEPLIFENYLIVCRDIYNNSIPETKILAYNKLSGDAIWEWQEVKYYSIDSSETYFAFSKMYAHDGILVGIDLTEIVGIDLSSGQTLWRLSYLDFPDISRIMDDGTFYIFLHATDPGNSGVSLIEVDIYTGATKKILDNWVLYNDQGALSLGFYPYLNEDDEKCIVFGLGHFTFPFGDESETELGLYNFNIDQNSQIFYSKLNTNSGVSQLFANKDHVFGSGFYRSKFDIITGELLYEKELEMRIKTDNLILFEYPHFYVMNNTTDPTLIKCDLESGEEIWRGRINGHQSVGFHKFNNSIFLVGGDGKLYQLDDNDGSLINSESSPYDGQSYGGNLLFFDNHFTIDQESGYVYLIDYVNLFCFDFND